MPLAWGECSTSSSTVAMHGDDVALAFELSEELHREGINPRSFCYGQGPLVTS